MNYEGVSVLIMSFIHAILIELPVFISWKFSVHDDNEVVAR